MVAHLDQQYLHVEQIGNVTLVTFNRREFLDEATIQLIGEQLLNLIRKFERPQLVLNLEAVQKLSTVMVGSFIALYKKVRAAGGRLVLCKPDPRIHEVLDILKLRQLVPVYRDEQEALQTF